MSDSFIGAGFSPRVNPRPEYEPFYIVLLHLAKSMLWQSAIFGLIITELMFPIFQDFVRLLRSFLGEYGSDAVIFSIVMNIVHTGTYVVVNGTFAFCDIYGYFQQYKLARKAYMVPKQSLVIKTVAEAAFGQLIINPIATYYLYGTMKYFGMGDLTDPLPGVKEMFTSFCIAYLVNGVGFYCAHRLFHAKALYATFHKQHHEFAGTVGIAAEYANPVEQIFANMLPTLGGVVFFPTHPLVVVVWLFLRLQQTYEAHSGYCFRGTLLDTLGFTHSEEAIHHDYHHTVNTGNFGTNYMDWLCGTQDGFMAGGGYDGYYAKKKLQLQKEKLAKENKGD
ncbi:SMO2-2 [Symbiodinium microadriaticum]|nr:SMO2-2 [Symbiodinium microadriaticum]